MLMADESHQASVEADMPRFLIAMHDVWINQASHKSCSPGEAPVAGGRGENMSYWLLRKVLVVDDEPDIADLAVALLRAHAVDTAVAYSAHEALQILKADKEIDVVVSDVMMPGMTGLELADAVREMYPCIKIILVSGYTHASLLVGRERQYLFATKPYQITTILGMLRS